MRYFFLSCFALIFFFWLFVPFSQLERFPAARRQAKPGLKIGLGKAEITGTIYGRHRMGYVKETQISRGLHTRLHARAFVVEDSTGSAAAYVVADLGMIFKGMRQEAVRRISDRTRGRLHDGNVMIAATHTHSAAAGLSHNHMFNLFYGFDSKDFELTVEGIANAVLAAQGNLGPGEILFSEGALRGASVNRSLVAFQKNPEAASQDAVDDDMSQLSFLSNGKKAGAFSWFAVHGTSMGNGNQLVSADNKGVAARLLERALRTENPAFLAAFSNGNEGDVSPLPNRWLTSIDRKATDAELAFQVGEKQAKMAQSLLASGESLGGTVDSRLAWVHMPSLSFKDSTGATQTLCSPALGYSMFAGTEDGRGELGYREGMLQGQPTELGLKGATAKAGVQNLLLQKPTKDSESCHAPMPVLADMSGNSSNFAPFTLPFQILRIGDIALVGVPGEATTVSGRRMLSAVRAPLEAAGVRRMVFVGLANDYAGYVSTKEEYSTQQYEGASTYYGPNELDGMSSILRSLALSFTDRAAFSAAELEAGRARLSKELQANADSIQTNGARWRYDMTEGYNLPPMSTDKLGVFKPLSRVDFSAGETVEALVSSPSPNVFPAGAPLFTVEHNEQGEWRTVFTDDDPETSVYWELRARCPACGHARLSWNIPSGTPSGLYRFVAYQQWVSVRPVAGKVEKAVASPEFRVR